MVCFGLWQRKYPHRWILTIMVVKKLKNLKILQEFFVLLSSKPNWYTLSTINMLSRKNYKQANDIINFIVDFKWTLRSVCFRCISIKSIECEMKRTLPSAAISKRFSSCFIFSGYSMQSTRDHISRSTQI